MDVDAVEAFKLADQAIERGAYNEAFSVALPWAQRGCGWAEACIASLYQCGLGVERDMGEAVRYFERSAGHDFVGALYSLGVIYEIGGDGVLADQDKAESFYQRAREMGYVLGAPFDPVRGEFGTPGSD
jgi:TPR repeat protein